MKIHPIAASLVLVITAPHTIAAQDKLPGHIVDVKAGEYFFHAPDTIPAGLTTFRLTQTGAIATNPERVRRDNLMPATATNDPTAAFHMLWVVRIDSGHTVNEWYATQLEGKRPGWAVKLGGPASADPPLTTNATMQLRPGNYVLACYIGSAREDQARHHLRKGMFRAMTVVASEGRTAVPASDVTAVISGDGQIALSGALSKGLRTIKVINNGAKEHEFMIARVNPDRRAEEAVTWKRRDGTSHPFAPRGGFSDIMPGATLWTTVNFESGNYIMWTVRAPATSAIVIVP